MYFIKIFYQNKDMVLIYLPCLCHMNEAFAGVAISDEWLKTEELLDLLNKAQ